MLQKFCLIFILMCNKHYNVVADDCTSLKKRLSDAQKDFIWCATRYSIPVQVCTQCIDRYINMKNDYSEIESICHDDFFDMDRLNVIQTVQEAVTRIWLKAFCDECFDSSTNHNETFSIKYDDYLSCIKQQTPEEVCTNCLFQYTTLNNFYILLYQENNGNVCFDWQDQMNRTRRQWGKEFKCSQHQHADYAYILMAIAVTCTVIVFYVAAYKITIYQERNNHHILLDGPSTLSTTSHTNTAARETLCTTNNTEKPSASKQLRTIVESDDESSSSENDVVMHKPKTK